MAAKRSAGPRRRPAEERAPEAWAPEAWAPSWMRPLPTGPVSFDRSLRRAAELLEAHRPAPSPLPSPADPGEARPAA